MMNEVRAYIDSLPEPRRSQIAHLHEVIAGAVPELDVRLFDYSGKLIGYGPYPYKPKSGPGGEWFMLCLGNRKNYISLYSMGVRDGKYLVELYHDRLPRTKTGKSCINITKPELLDDAVIADLARETHQVMKEYLAAG
jgi:hypothetical protein